MKARRASVRLAAFAGGLVLTMLFAGGGMAGTGGKSFVDRAAVHKVPRTRHSFVPRRPAARFHAVAPIVGTTVLVDSAVSASPVPLVVIQEAPLVRVQDESPPPPAQPSYSWYYCGPTGTLPQPGEPAPAYCLDGVQPSLSVPPGPGKTLEQFQADDRACRQWASAQASALPGVGSPSSVTTSPIAGSVQERYDRAYHWCMYAKQQRLPEVARTPPPTATPPTSTLR